MDQLETDIVLSAIRRGEDSLPRLRSATGLDYAKLHVVLHELEFEWRSIQRGETAAGFDRYKPTPSEKSNGPKGTHWKEEHRTPIAPKSLHSTKLAGSARDLALLQREAPYCVTCRSVCVLHGTDRKDRIRWRCRTCTVTFAGSGCPGDPNVNRIKPEKREKAISAFNEGKSVRTVAKEAEISKASAQKIRNEENITALCPCGEDAQHKGWCSFRFQNSPARQATIKKMNMGHIDPESDDTPMLEGDINAKCGCGYSTNHRGKCADGQAKHARVAEVGENITKTITRNGTKPAAESGQDERAELVTVDKSEDKIEVSNPANKISAFPTNGRVADFSPSTEEPKRAMADLLFPPSAILKKIVMNDDYFPEAYNVLIGILDADMDEAEQMAVWTLLRYLKRVEKSHQEAWFYTEIETVQEACANT